MAEEDVTDGRRIDLGGEQAAHEAEPAAGVEEHARARRLHEDGGLVALRIERATGAEEHDARARHRARA